MTQQKPAANTQQQDARDIVYTPAEVGTLVLSAVQDRREHPGAGVRSYIPVLDKHLLPLRPGELVTVMGRPSNYKTGLMQFWARNVAHEIVDTDAEHEVVIFVTWEMAVEELGLYDLAGTAQLDASEISQGRVDDTAWDRLQTAAMQRATIPLWIVGHSIERRRKRPDLTLSNVARALLWIDSEMGYHPRIVFLDYLNQMQPEKGEDRRMQVFENVRRCKDMALALGCPVVLGVQAGRQVDERNWKLPEMGDGLESSNIEHTADKMLSLWMPKTTEPTGSELHVPGAKESHIEINDRLLVVGLKKQKLGPANKVAFLSVDAASNRITDLDLHSDSPAW